MIIPEPTWATHEKNENASPVLQQLAPADGGSVPRDTHAGHEHLCAHCGSIDAPPTYAAKAEVGLTSSGSALESSGSSFARRSSRDIRVFTVACVAATFVSLVFLVLCCDILGLSYSSPYLWDASSVISAPWGVFVAWALCNLGIVPFILISGRRIAAASDTTPDTSSARLVTRFVTLILLFLGWLVCGAYSAIGQLVGTCQPFLRIVLPALCEEVATAVGLTFVSVALLVIAAVAIWRTSRALRRVGLGVSVN
ncbi:hypothetical protein HMN09_00260800 [Mycena chlorophos]|uniref:Uncharacterized protein n=1 Tax=Mycena chlorophos TaxID=658473 RepID=A0A8H6TLE5_MYCCL|nr:hypothetical protein HMN09_00260800 [Mycena chlorophos]